MGLNSVPILTVMADEEKLPDMPEKCPVCKKAAKNLLLHIIRKESCYSKIDSKLYDHWKKENNRSNKKKYQVKYIKSGNHKKAQSKYEQKFRTYCNVCEKKEINTLDGPKIVFQSKEECKCPPVNVDRKSFLKIKSHNQSKYRNRNRIRWGEDDASKRLNSFRNLCWNSLKCLKRGKIEFKASAKSSIFNTFHLVEAETWLQYHDNEGNDIQDYDDDETHSWLSDVDGTLLSMVITFQKVVLIPKSRWTRALAEVNTNDDKKHMSNE